MIKKVHILRVDIVDGSDLKFGWKNKMQVVYTTKGIYISSLDVIDWSEYVNDCVKYRVEISEGSGHLWIAKPTKDYYNDI
jgi:hypothetical protein